MFIHLSTGYFTIQPYYVSKACVSHKGAINPLCSWHKGIMSHPIHGILSMTFIIRMPWHMKSILMDILRLTHWFWSADALTVGFGNINASTEFRQIIFHSFLRCLSAGTWIPISELCHFPFIFIIKSLADLNAKNLSGVTFKTYKK